MQTTVGQLLINEALPAEMRDYTRRLDKKGINQLLQRLALEHPEQYREASHKLANVGRRTSHEVGGYSFTLKHMLKSKAGQATRQKITKQLASILSRDDLTDDQRNKAIVLATGRELKNQQEAVYDEALAANNPLAFQVQSGSRGNKMNLSSLLGSDLLYTDQSNESIPIPVLRSYSEGLTPAEYFAGSFGARRGTLSTKLATQNAGFAGKQLAGVSHRLMVTAEDDEEDTDAVNRGVPFSTDDMDSEGALLARPVGGYERNTILTPKIIRQLNRQGHKRILVRSPMTGGSRDGGVFARDVGIRETGRLPQTGEMTGLAAAQALCLAEGTRVRMVDGSVKKIQDIVAGDFVFGCTVSGVLTPVKVIDTYKNGVKACYLSVFECRSEDGLTVRRLSLVSTLEHKILGASGELAAEIRPVGKLNSSGPTTYAQLPAASLLDLSGYSQRCKLVSQELVGDLETFDIQVDHPDHLFMLDNELVVSNSEPILQSGLCLDQDTLVRMADLSSRRIADLRPGDRVTGADIHGNVFPVTVVDVFDNGERECVEQLFAARDQSQTCPEDAKLVATLDHQILILKNDSTRKMPLRGIGNALVPHVDAVGVGRTYQSKSQKSVGVRHTFDIEVDHPDHLFVLANGIIVSNSEKHSGGVAGESSASSGFAYLNRLLQVPKSFQGGATHSQHDGMVSGIEKSPTGGSYILVNGEQHYVPENLAINVKKGDRVEAGDVLTDGSPNPAEIVKHKGIGEGRRYFTDIFRQAMSNSGVSANRRNVELLSRGLIDHVRLTKEHGDHVPDDVIPYSVLEKSWKPRKGYRTVPYRQSIGKHLERPVLHYSVGTKIKPSVIRDFKEFGIENVDVHDDPPPFKPEMIRAMGSLQYDPDWMTRMNGSGLKAGLLRGVHRGSTSDESGTSFVPALARGEHFGSPDASTKQTPGSFESRFSAADSGKDYEYKLAAELGSRPPAAPKVPSATNTTAAPAASTPATQTNDYSGSAPNSALAGDTKNPYSANPQTVSKNKTTDSFYKPTTSTPHQTGVAGVDTGMTTYRDQGYSPERAAQFAIRDHSSSKVNARPKQAPVSTGYGFVADQAMGAAGGAYEVLGTAMGGLEAAGQTLGGLATAAGVYGSNNHDSNYSGEGFANDMAALPRYVYNQVSGTRHGEGAASNLKSYYDLKQDVAGAYNNPDAALADLKQKSRLANMRLRDPEGYNQLVNSAAQGDEQAAATLERVADAAEKMKSNYYTHMYKTINDARAASPATGQVARGLNNAMSGVPYLAAGGTGFANGVSRFMKATNFAPLVYGFTGESNSQAPMTEQQRTEIMSAPTSIADMDRQRARSPQLQGAAQSLGNGALQQLIGQLSPAALGAFRS